MCQVFPIGTRIGKGIAAKFLKLFRKLDLPQGNVSDLETVPFIHFHQFHDESPTFYGRLDSASEIIASRLTTGHFTRSHTWNIG